MTELSKVVWSENGEIKKLKGEIIGEDEHFITLKTLSHEYRINKKVIIKIQGDVR